MIDPHVREARRLQRFNPETYTDHVLARRYGVTVRHLREAIRATQEKDRLKNQRRAQVVTTLRRQMARPVDEALLRRRRHLVLMEAIDTRDLTGRLLGDPLPSRSALRRATVCWPYL